MQLFPEISIQWMGGWLLTIAYLIVNLGLPMLRKGALARLLTHATPEESGGKPVLKWTGQLSWIATLALPVLHPLTNNRGILIAGLGLFSTGILFTAVALVNYTLTPSGEPVVTGVYRFSRNPIYAAYALVGYGMALMVGSWTIVVLHTVENLVSHRMVLQEEKYCSEKYGEPYREYMKKVPRYAGLF